MLLFNFVVDIKCAITKNQVRSFDNRYGKTLRFPRARLQPPKRKTAASKSSDTCWGCANSPHRKPLFPQESPCFPFASRCYYLIYMLYLHKNQGTSTSGVRIRRLLENTVRFSACDVTLPKHSLSYGNSTSPKTPQDKENFSGITSHAEKVVFFFKEALFASEEAEAVPMESGVF